MLNNQTVRQSEQVVELIRRSNRGFQPIISDVDHLADCPQLDLSHHNRDFCNLNWREDVVVFDNYINAYLKEHQAVVAIGKYDEDRVIYNRSDVFRSPAGDRTIHLGLDYWVQAGTSIYAPLDGVIHDFNNDDILDGYGPVVVLRHEIEQQQFFTLYGHLSRESLADWERGKKIKAGEQVGSIGTSIENGQWPPHLHFQIMIDDLGLGADFPGVACRAEADYYRTLCPNPEILAAGRTVTTNPITQAQNNLWLRQQASQSPTINL